MAEDEKGFECSKCNSPVDCCPLRLDATEPLFLPNGQKCKRIPHPNKNRECENGLSIGWLLLLAEDEKGFECSKCNSPVDCCPLRLDATEPLFLPNGQKCKRIPHPNKNRECENGLSIGWLLLLAEDEKGFECSKCNSPVDCCPLRPAAENLFDLRQPSVGCCSGGRVNTA